VVVAPGVGLRLAHLVGALEQLRRHVVPRRHLLLQLAPPGREVVDPALDDKAPLTHPIEGQRGVPAIVVEGIAQRRGLGAALARREVQHPGRENIMPVGEDIRADPQSVPHQSLHRVPSVRHRRRDAAHDQMG
jgi:hypothetical protein